MQSYYIYRNDSQSGPFAKEEIRRMVLAGEANRADHCWADGMSDWKPIDQVIELPPASPVPVSPPPSPVVPRKTKAAPKKKKKVVDEGITGISMLAGIAMLVLLHYFRIWPWHINLLVILVLVGIGGIIDAKFKK